MTRPSSTCSSGVVQAAAAGSRTWEGNKKKKTSTLALPWPPCFRSNFKALQLTQHYTDLHHLKAVSMFTVQTLQRRSHNRQREKKNLWYWNSCKRENTAPTYSLLLPFLMQYFFFHVPTINFYVRKSTRGKKREKGDCHPFVNFLHPQETHFQATAF